MVQQLVKNYNATNLSTDSPIAAVNYGPSTESDPHQKLGKTGPTLKKGDYEGKASGQLNQDDNKQYDTGFALVESNFTDPSSCGDSPNGKTFVIRGNGKSWKEGNNGNTSDGTSKQEPVISPNVQGEIMDNLDANEVDSTGGASGDQSGSVIMSDFQTESGVLRSFVRRQSLPVGEHSSTPSRRGRDDCTRSAFESFARASEGGLTYDVVSSTQSQQKTTAGFSDERMFLRIEDDAGTGASNDSTEPVRMLISTGNINHRCKCDSFSDVRKLRDNSKPRSAFQQ